MSCRELTSCDRGFISRLGQLRCPSAPLEARPKLNTRLAFGPYPPQEWCNCLARVWT